MSQLKRPPLRRQNTQELLLSLNSATAPLIKGRDENAGQDDDDDDDDEKVDKHVNKSVGTLSLRVLQGRNLAIVRNAFPSDKQDPFVSIKYGIVELYTEDSFEGHTSPTWEDSEPLVYSIDEVALRSEEFGSVLLSVHDRDIMNETDVLIGSAEIDIALLLGVKKKSLRRIYTKTCWVNLSEEKGEIEIAYTLEIPDCYVSEIAQDEEDERLSQPPKETIKIGSEDTNVTETKTNDAPIGGTTNERRAKSRKSEALIRQLSSQKSKREAAKTNHSSRASRSHPQSTRISPDKKLSPDAMGSDKESDVAVIENHSYSDITSHGETRKESLPSSKSSTLDSQSSSDEKDEQPTKQRSDSFIRRLSKQPDKLSHSLPKNRKSNKTSTMSDEMELQALKEEAELLEAEFNEEKTTQEARRVSSQLIVSNEDTAKDDTKWVSLQQKDFITQASEKRPLVPQPNLVKVDDTLTILSEERKITTNLDMNKKERTTTERSAGKGFKVHNQNHLAKNAAVHIQRVVRGFLARRRCHRGKKEETNRSNEKNVLVDEKQRRMRERSEKRKTRELQRIQLVKSTMERTSPTRSSASSPKRPLTERDQKQELINRKIEEIKAKELEKLQRRQNEASVQYQERISLFQASKKNKLHKTNQVHPMESITQGDEGRQCSADGDNLKKTLRVVDG